MHTLIIKAYRDLTRRKLRSALTLVGILIGVAGIVAIVTTAQSLADAQTAAYNNASQNDVWCWTWNASPAIQRPLEAIPNVAAVELRTSYYTRWRVPAQYGIGTAWRSVRLIGLNDYENVRVNQVLLREGNWPGPGEVLVEQSSLDANPVRIGDTITIKTREGRGERTLTVSGIAWTPAYPSAAILATSLCYAPAADVQEFAGLTGDNQILFKLTDMGQRDETAKRISETLRRRNVWFDQMHVRDPDEFVGKRELQAVFAVMTLFTALGLVISGFLVANTLSAIVSEQVGEIGAIKAVGGTRQQVLALYLVASALYGVVGTVVGSIIGFLGSGVLIDYIAPFLTLDVGRPVVPRAFALGAGVGIGVAIVAGFWPAWHGTGISVREALAAYGIVSTYGQGTVDRLLRRVRGLPPLVLFSARNLGRRKSRSLITFLAIGVAAAAFLAAQATSISVETAIDTLFNVYNTDAWVWFEEPVQAGFTTRLAAVPGVAAVERWGNVHGYVQHVQALIYGLPADTQMYRHEVVAGRWFAPGAWDEIVLTTGLADEAGVRVGDTVTMDIWGNQRAFQVVGLAVDNITSGIGATPIGKAFAPGETVSRVMGRQGW
ncbi:MAG: ABC transporter permease, partial [Chloroflexi bacterium]|nr:ABC transporter permease [Chloroflexota bacterium]